MTWANVRGPLEVLWLTIARIGWDMLSCTTLVDDQGCVICLLQVPPKSVLELARQSIERWQGRNIMEHHKDICYGDEVIWLRMLRKCIGGPAAAVRQPRFAGALRSLWAGGIWTRDRQHQAGYHIPPDCPWCSAPLASESASQRTRQC